MTIRNKTRARAQWALEHCVELEAAVTPLEGSLHNAKYNKGMSSGGWGYWARALEEAGLGSIVNRMPYWEGKNPTPSTAINLGVAQYIMRYAPAELL